MKRTLALLPAFCSAAIALALFTLIVLYGYSRFIHQSHPVLASTTVATNPPASNSECMEGPILAPRIDQKLKEPKILVHLFSLGVGGYAHLYDPPNMKPRKIEITSGWPLKISDQNCKPNSLNRIWFCADKKQDILISDSRPASYPASTNFVAVTWLEY